MTERFRDACPYRIRTICKAKALGAMSPVMAVSVIAPAITFAVVWALARGNGRARRPLVAAVAYGALVYQSTLVVGLAFRSVSLLAKGFVLSAIVMLVFSVGLATTGVALGKRSARV